MCHPYLRLTVMREGMHVWKARSAVTVPHVCPLPTLLNQSFCILVLAITLLLN
jgi:hypothetical protein